MAAHRAFVELLEIIQVKGEEIIFKSYVEMGLAPNRMAYYRKLKRFEDHGLIKRIQTRPKRVFVITKKAKLLRHKAIIKELRKDGFSTLVTFDVPEEKHNTRDTLRRYLVRNGYTQIQKSTFISPFKISSDLKDLVEELKLDHNVKVFICRIDYVFR